VYYLELEKKHVRMPISVPDNGCPHKSQKVCRKVFNCIKMSSNGKEYY